jgi:hypothetical protein
VTSTTPTTAFPLSQEPRPEAGDQAVDPVVVRAEGVLAENRALGLVVELQVHPIDGEIPPLSFGGVDELASQLGASRLRRFLRGPLDILLVAHALDHVAPFEKVVQSTLSIDVVIGEVH